MLMFNDLVFDVPYHVISVWGKLVGLKDYKRRLFYHCENFKLVSGHISVLDMLNS